jgi:SAM-dependent methyltransferase
MSRTANFDAIAVPYRTLEYLTLGKKLERTRLHFLDRVRTAHRALVLGDGDGRFLAQLFAANPKLQVTAIDSSARMLDLLQQRCALFADRLQTVQVDALGYIPSPSATYDLLVSHFFLDCFTERQLNELIGHIAPALEANAQWLLSDFRIPSGRMRLPAQVLVRSLYLAFHILTGLRTTSLPHHASCLSAAGFARVDRKLYLGGILSAELWRLQNPYDGP